MGLPCIASHGHLSKTTSARSNSLQFEGVRDGLFHPGKSRGPVGTYRLGGLTISPLLDIILRDCGSRGARAGGDE